jgi:Tfp pilus assembly protein PilF
MLYWPATSGELVWDDWIVADNHLPAFQSLRDLFFPPGDIPQWPAGMYRPILIASYLLDERIFGHRASVGPHIVGIALHLAATLLGSLLAARLLVGARHRWLVVLAAGMFFACLPTHTESVCWISGRSDVLATVFVLAALLTGLAYRDSGKVWQLLAASAFLFLGTLAKEVALSTLPLLSLILVAGPALNGGPVTPTARGQGVERKRSIRDVLLLSSFTLSALSYAGLRAAAAVGLGQQRAEGGAPAAAVARALAYYVGKAFVPWPPSALVSELPSPGWTALWLALLGTALAGAMWRARRCDEWAWSFGLLWFVTAIAPSLPVAIRSVSETPVAERYLYLPSWGICLVLGSLAVAGYSRPRWRQISTGVAVAALAILATLTVQRVKTWHSDLTLWEDTVERSPSAGLAWGQLGKAYLDRGLDLDKALDYLQRAVELYDDAEGRSIAYNSIGVIHAKRGEREQAAAAWRASIAERGDYALPHFNLGNLGVSSIEAQVARGQSPDLTTLTEACAHYQRALEIDPRHRRALLQLLKCEVEGHSLHLQARETDAANEALERAEQLVRRISELDRDGTSRSEAAALIQVARQVGSPRLP